MKSDIRDRQVKHIKFLTAELTDIFSILKLSFRENIFCLYEPISSAIPIQNFMTGLTNSMSFDT